MREKTLYHDLFNDVLSSEKNVRKSVTQSQSQHHQLLVTQINKIVVSAFEDGLDLGRLNSVFRLWSSNRVLFVMFILVLLIFHLNIIDFIFQYCSYVPHVHSELIETTAVLSDDVECETHSTTSSSTPLSHARVESVSEAYFSSLSSTARYCTPLNSFHFA